MSADSNLQETENAVTKGAAPAEPMAGGVPYEDLEVQLLRTPDQTTTLTTQRAYATLKQGCSNARALRRSRSR